MAAKTGFAAAFDLPPAQATQIAVADINKAGGVLGRPLKLVFQDTKSQLSLGTSGALATIGEGAEMGIVTCDVNLGAPAATEFGAHHMVSISLCAGDPHFQDVSPFAYSAGVAVQDEAAGAAQFASQSKHWNSAYVVYDTSLSYYQAFEAGFTKSFKAWGGTVDGVESFNGSSPSSVSAPVSHIASAKPSVVVVCSQTSLGGPALIKAIRAAGITAPILMCVGMEGLAWLKSVPGLTNAYVTGYADFMGKDPNPAVNAFSTRFISEFGRPDNSHPTEGYASVQILVDAIKAAGSTSGPAMQAALNKFTNVETLAGPTTFTPAWHTSFGRQVAIQAVQNGTLVTLYTIRPTKVFYPTGQPVPATNYSGVL